MLSQKSKLSVRAVGLRANPPTAKVMTLATVITIGIPAYFP